MNKESLAILSEYVDAVERENLRLLRENEDLRNRNAELEAELHEHKSLTD